MSLKHRHKIAVLMGGVSNERSVSFKSGKAITTALRQAGHQVVPVDVTERNVDRLDRVRPDLAFIALHGEFGEDGEVQHLLQQKGIPYTGSGPEASRAGMDKVASKRAFVRHAVPTADYLVVERGRDGAELLAQAEQLGFPLVCKPSHGGSSLGVSIVRSRSRLPLALCSAFLSAQTHGAGPSAAGESQVLLEQYVPGRELTVGVLDGVPLPVVEIRSTGSFFDYDAKYKAQDTRYIVPASLLKGAGRRAQEAGRRACEALGCRHLARADLIYGADGDFYVLEVNTIPGFTPRSLLPMAAAHAGIEFPELCERIAAMALRDAPRSRQTA